MILTKPEILQKRIFNIADDVEFHRLALDIFLYQAYNCEVYRDFLSYLNVNEKRISKVSQIPFLPIEFFKTHEVKTGDFKEEITFLSSATSGLTQSKHFVKKIKLYEESFLKAFQLFYGDTSEYCILALLPSYSEREGSSLIYMVDKLMQKSEHPLNSYFLNDHNALQKTISDLESKKQKYILFGVSYALLDFCEQYQNNIEHGIIIETGGMKGKRKEIIKPELHEIISNSFGTKSIHSEYSMTELMSQAYSIEKGIFFSPPWMKILIRDTTEPQHILSHNRSGGINIIDLANLYSCSFIATQDLGKTIDDERFEVLGRFDNSDVRGCNLLVQ